jgi:hypothetical protein
MVQACSRTFTMSKNTLCSKKAFLAKKKKALPFHGLF